MVSTIPFNYLHTDLGSLCTTVKSPNFNVSNGDSKVLSLMLPSTWFRGTLVKRNDLFRKILAQLYQILSGRSHYFCPRYVTVSHFWMLYSTHFQLPDPAAKCFTPEILRRAMLDTISTLNSFAAEAGITEVCLASWVRWKAKACLQPSLMNFCVTDGETVVATRYISSRKDEAASLVRVSAPVCSCFSQRTAVVLLWDSIQRIC